MKNKLLTIFVLFLISPSGFTNDKLKIEFSKVITTCLTAEFIWEDFTKALVNSNDRQIWPNQHSDVLGDGLFENGKIAVTYKSSLSDFTYSYYIRNVKPGFSFEYIADENHPFEGGAKISIQSTEQFRTLSWIGSYDVIKSDWLKQLFFRHFTVKFFASLERRILSLEN
jgi:hypothetical protein